MAARRLLWALAPFGVWADKTLGSFAAHSVSDRNVEAWIAVVNQHRPQGWRNASRAVLRQVGRTVNRLSAFQVGVRVSSSAQLGLSA